MLVYSSFSSLVVTCMLEHIIYSGHSYTTSKDWNLKFLSEHVKLDTFPISFISVCFLFLVPISFVSVCFLFLVCKSLQIPPNISFLPKLAGTFSFLLANILVTRICTELMPDLFIVASLCLCNKLIIHNEHMAFRHRN